MVLVWDSGTDKERSDSWGVSLSKPSMNRFARDHSFPFGTFPQRDHSFPFVGMRIVKNSQDNHPLPYRPYIAFINSAIQVGKGENF